MIEKIFSAGLVWSGEHSCLEEKFSLGVESIDSELGGLRFGAIHEFASSDELLPSFLPTYLAARLLAQKPDKRIAWVGKNSFPSPYVLNLFFKQLNFEPDLSRCLFLDPSPAKHLWTATETLKNPSIAGAIIDASGLSFTKTRRLQLATRHESRDEAGLGILVRPLKELKNRSCAQTKCLIAALPSESSSHRWSITFEKAPALIQPISWEIEWNNEEGFKYLPPVFERRAGKELRRA